MASDLVTELLPVLGRKLDLGFNVFDVMHHGMHEKQISNVFKWLLDKESTHALGDSFLRMFIDELNRSPLVSEAVPYGAYAIRQEVNIAGPDSPADIADIVIENRETSIVVENFFTSDGHGHSFEGYLRYGQRDGRRGVVVLLCASVDSSLQTLGWQNAVVLTYPVLVQRLWDSVERDWKYQKANSDAFAFLHQLHAKFVKGRGRMQQQDVLDFVVAMCDSGEASRYAHRPVDIAGEQFAADLAEQARERFGEGRELLLSVKHRLRSYVTNELRGQLSEAFGAGTVISVRTRYTGSYEWTVRTSFADDFGTERSVLLRFGPSAWHAVEQDSDWEFAAGSAEADYSRLFVLHPESRTIRQSAVALREVLDGLEPEDRRLRDEIVDLVSAGA